MSFAQSFNAETPLPPPQERFAQVTARFRQMMDTVTAAYLRQAQDRDAPEIAAHLLIDMAVELFQQTGSLEKAQRMRACDDALLGDGIPAEGRPS